MGKVAAYTRISTSHGHQLTGQSLDQQSEAIKTYCHRNDLAEPDFFTDQASGFKDDREQYQRLIKHCEADEYDTVICFDLSRVGRKASEVLRFLDFLNERKIRFIAVRQALDSNSIAGKTIIALIAVLNAMAHDEASARTRATFALKRDRNEKLGGFVPYGWDLHDDGVRLIPNAREYDVLFLITELRAKGLSLRAIAAELNSRGIPTKTKRSTGWLPATVRKLLARRRHLESNSDHGVYDARNVANSE